MTICIFITAILILDFNVSVEMDTLRLVCTLNCLSMWVRLLYWLNLFKNTSYFILLIKQTLIDIRYFAFIMIMIIVTFANIISFLDIHKGDDGLHIIQEETGYHWFDSLFYVYLLMLGHFDIERLKNGPTNGLIMYILFILASFFLIVILLNM